MLPKDRFDALLRAGAQFSVDIPVSNASAIISNRDGFVSISFGPHGAIDRVDADVALGKLNTFLARSGLDVGSSYDPGAVTRMKFSNGSKIVSTILATDGSFLSEKNALVSVVEGRRSRLFEFDITNEGSMLEKTELKMGDLSVEWLGRLAWSEIWVDGCRKQPRELFIARYGEAALEEVGAAIEAEEDGATAVLHAVRYGKLEPTGSEAATDGNVWTAWLSIAEEPQTEPEWKAPDETGLSPLELERATEAVPGNAIWQGSGEIEDVPWRAGLYGTPSHRNLVVRIELDKAEATEWDIFSFDAEVPGIPRAWRMRSLRYSPEICVQVEGFLTLFLTRREPTTFWIEDHPPEHPRSRGGPKLSSTEIVSVVAERILAQRSAFLIQRVLHVHRSRTAATIKDFALACQKLQKAKEDVQTSIDLIEALIETLPGRDNRKLQKMPISEMTADPEYLRDTALGVLRMLPLHDGSGICIEPTGRRCKIAIQGRLRDIPTTYTTVDRDGSIASAAYDGCSEAVGDRLLLEAVRSFVDARPEAFIRARIAQVARHTSELQTILDREDEAYDVADEALIKRMEVNEVVLEFAQGRPEAMGISWPPYPRSEAAEEAGQAEEPSTAGPSPLW